MKVGAVERSQGVNGKRNNKEYMLISMKGRKTQYMSIWVTFRQDNFQDSRMKGVN